MGVIEKDQRNEIILNDNIHLSFAYKKYNFVARILYRILVVYLSEKTLQIYALKDGKPLNINTAVTETRRLF